MAVPKRRKSRSRTRMGRSHSALSKPTLSVDPTSGEVHRRHHITEKGFYRGRQVIDLSGAPNEEDDPLEDAGSGA